MWSKVCSHLIEFVRILGGNYKVFVIHTTEEVGLYRWETWKQLMPMITTLLSITAEKAYIRTNQISANGNGRLGFGRMPWNEESNRKWTTKYLEGPGETGVRFCDTEIWAPDWNNCLKRQMNPDLFVMVQNCQGAVGLAEVLVIALPVHLFHKHQVLIGSEVEKMRSIVPGSGLSGIVRGWGGRVAVRNAIMDLNPQQIRKIIDGAPRS